MSNASARSYRCLFVLLMLLSGYRVSHAQVVINELGIAPTCASCNAAQGGEFIELFNMGPCTANIGCDVIVYARIVSAGSYEGFTIVIPAGTTLAPCAYYLIGGAGKTSGSGGWRPLPVGGPAWDNPAGGPPNLSTNTATTTGNGGIIPGNLVDKSGQVALISSTGALISSVSWNSGNDPNCYPANTVAGSGCGALAGITIPDSPNNVNATFNGTTGDHGIALQAGGTYVAINTDGTPGVANTPDVPQSACSLVGGITAQATTHINASCGGNNGSVTIGATTGGTPSYSYNFNGGGFSSTTVYNNLAAGTYTIVVDDAGGCSYTTTVVVGSSPGPTALATTPTNTSCGGTTGSVTIGATTGGTPSYTYNFNSLGYSGTTTFNNLGAGTYPVIVKDANGCTYSTSVTIGNNPGPTALTVTPANTSCGGTTGSVTIGATTGGTGPFTYNFNSLGYSGTTTFNNLAAGTYPVLVKDAHGCIYSTNVVVGNNPGPTALSTTPTNTSCGGTTGTVVIGATTGGTGPFTYNFNSLGYSGTTTFNNLAAGTYPVLVKDANGCIYSTSVVVGNNPGPTALTTTPTNTSCGGTTGSVVIGATTGGTGPFTYNFNSLGYAGTTTFNNLAAGTYPVIVKDAHGCTFTTSAVVGNNTGPTALATTPVNTSCGGTTGSATIGATTGGTGPFTYNFNGLGYAGTTVFNNLGAGTYPVIVKDANGCTYTTNVTIGNNPGPTALVTTPTNTNCGGATGTVTIGATTGGTGPFTYNFNSLGFAPTTTFTNLGAGIYSVIVKDAHGCTFTTSATIGNNSGPAAAASQTVSGTCGQANGSASVTASGGTGTLTYSWTGGVIGGGQGTTNVTGLSAGTTYTVTVTDANGCLKTSTVVIGNTAGPNVTASTFASPSCHGSCSGSASVTASGGTGTLTYSWSPSGGNSHLTPGNLCAGNYTCTITDASGCTTNQIVAVTQPSQVIATVTQTSTATCGQSNGAASVSASGGSGPYVYFWSGGPIGTGQNTTNVTGLSATTYTVTVTDSKNCPSSFTVNISNSPGPSITASSGTAPNCNGGCTGQASVTGTGGNGALTYSWSPSGGAAAITAATLCPNTYTCTITDATGCTTTQSIVITNPSAVTNVPVITGPATCGQSDGTASVTAGGGTGPYTYSWTGGPIGTGQGTSSVTGLNASTYTITITDNLGCATPFTLIINNTGGPVINSSLGTGSVCNGGCIGQASVTASGGTGTLTYSWAPLGGTNPTTAANLCANTYTCTITDATGCQTTQTVAVTDPLPVTASAAQTGAATCGQSNGTASVTASGGTGTLTYSWTGGPVGTGQGTTSVTGLTGGIMYTVTVTDASACSQTSTVSISNSGAPTVNSSNGTNPLCNGGCTGSANVSASGGTGTLTYSWSPSGGNAATTTSTLCANTYTCTITDASGCVTLQTIAVTDPAIITATPAQTAPASCGQANGAASVSPSGGATPYTYSWTGGPIGTGQGTASVTGLAAGTYTVSVTDNNGCSLPFTVLINNALAPNITSSSGTGPNCNGACTGQASVNASGGSGALTYSWSPSGGATSATTTTLCANTYTCTVTDASGCQTSQTVVITDPTVVSGIAAQTAPATCGQSNGNASVTPSGGTGPYTYSWTGGPVGTGQGTNAVTGLSATTYTVVVTDSKGCSNPATVTVVITNTGAPTVSASSGIPSSCNAACSGSATVTATGGTGALSYSWSPSGGNAAATPSTLCAGIYTCTITDATGCITTQTLVLTDPSALVVSTASSMPASCNTSNGSAVVNVSGGTPGYTYTWAGGGTTDSIFGVPAGSYSVTVTDTHNCPQTYTVTINNSGGPVATLNISVNPTCNASCNGFAQVTASGGALPYTYSWFPVGGTADTAAGLCGGSYTCTIHDANNCLTTQIANIIQPGALSILPATTGVSCNGGSNGIASVTMSGGTAGYTYSWSPTGGANATASGLTTGNYTCLILDGNGCKDSATFSITQPPLLSSSATGTGSTCGTNNGSANATAFGGTGAYTYSWTPAGGNAATATAIGAGLYTCIVSDANGCIANDTLTLSNTGLPPIPTIAAGGPTIFCIGGNVLLQAAGGGTYSWNTGATTDTLTASLNGIYTVTVTNACGSVSTTLDVTVTPHPVAAVSGNQIVCKGDSVLISASGGSTYSWSTGATTPSIYVSVAGTYSVMAINNCGTSVATTILTVDNTIAHFGSDSTSGYAPLTVVLQDSSSGTPGTWNWNFGDGTTGTGINPTHTYTTPGIYTATVVMQSTNGCPSTYSEVITVNEVLSWVIIPNIFTPNGDGSNDIFFIKSQGLCEFSLKIYDRWGVGMANIISSNEGWDGRTLAGEKASMGTYYFILHAQGCDGKKYDVKGYLQLMY